MDEQRARIHDDLRDLISGELLFEPIERAPYAHDASIYEIDPLGVACPRTEDELAAIVRYASDNAIPVHARGAGTGLAGESLGPGLVVDFARHLRRIVHVGAESATVQAGVVLDRLNAHLAPTGRKIGPDPGGSESCTIGGMIALNAAGARSLRYGAMADCVERLRVVFANGEVADLERSMVPQVELLGDDPLPFRDLVSRRVSTLLHYHEETIARQWPRSLRNRAGYAIHSALSAGSMDLARLIVGSEGTLALVAEATLRTVPIPAAQSVLLLPFGRMHDAAEAVLDCLEDGPSAVELHDWRTLSLARDSAADFRDWIPEAAEAALIVEFEGDDPSVVSRRARSLADRLGRRGGLVADPIESSKRADCERLLGLRHAVEPTFLRLRSKSRAVPLFEDVAVPPEALADYLAKLQNILRDHGVTGTVEAHAGCGQVHARPFLDLSSAEDAAKLEPLATAAHEAAIACGGTVSGEHGCGLLRTQFVRRQYGDIANIFREVKNAFDPQDLLNPGKVVGDDPHLMTRDLKIRPPVEPPAASMKLPVLLTWPDRSMEETVSACNGCGACRTDEPSLRMCPSFRASRSEAAAPRSQANLLRQIASGVLDPKLWGSEEMKANADLCVHCQLCRSECPAGVDVSGLMLEAKAAYVADHGLAADAWLLSRIDVWSRWASRFPVLYNLMMGSRPARWLLERGFGLSRLRRLPKARRTSFLRRAEKLGLTKPNPRMPGPRVAYFVDTAADHFQQDLAETVVAVLRQAGVNVYVPKGQRGCGMPALVAGDLDRARALVVANLRVLGNAVRDGYTVVCSEPTAALMLKHDALRLTDNLDAALVAANTMDVGQYLAGLMARDQFRRPEVAVRARVGYHQPCHLRALGVGTPGLDLIRAIPELEVEFIDRGCSGIAGTHGFSRANFRGSLRAGRALRNRLKDSDLDLGATECSTCRIQMEHNLPKRTLHPMQLLSLGYGLNPHLRASLREPKPKGSLS